MATARPLRPVHRTNRALSAPPSALPAALGGLLLEWAQTHAPTLGTIVAAAEAEAAWRRMVDAQCADLAFLRERWPDHTSPEVEACNRRLLAREAPGGEAEQALGQLDEAYGGADRVPLEVRR